jgi:hypothetical protein
MMSVMSLRLMYTASLTLHRTMTMTVNNWYPDIRLASPMYFCNGGIYYEHPVRRAYAGAIMMIDFRLDLDQDASNGILIYELQRKENAESDQQSSVDTIYTKVIEEASKMMRLLITWKIKHLEEPKVSIVLVECDNELVLNEDKLARLYDKVNAISSEYSNPSRRTWLMCDNTALGIMYVVEDLELKITISEVSRERDAIKLMWIDPER